MAKIAKLLNDPRAFFLDAHSSAVRVSGLWLLDRFPIAAKALGFVGAPVDSMLRSHHAFVAVIGLGVDRCLGAFRLRHIRSCGEPAISVIMPAYNVAGYIGRAIESVCNQTYQNWELVIIDDASTDNTRDVVAQWMQRDTRIRLLSLERNAGPGGARNIGIRVASGKFITFQDADDASFIRRLEVQLYGLVSGRNKRLSTCRYCRVDKSMNPVAFNGAIFRKSITSMMFPRALVSSVGYFGDERLGEDSDYFRRLQRCVGSSGEVFSRRVMYFAMTREESLFIRGVRAKLSYLADGRCVVTYGTCSGQCDEAGAGLK